VPKNPQEFFRFNFGYDVVRDSKMAMKRVDPEWVLPGTFFETEPGGGVYP